MLVVKADPTFGEMLIDMIKINCIVLCYASLISTLVVSTVNAFTFINHDTRNNQQLLMRISKTTSCTSNEPDKIKDRNEHEDNSKRNTIKYLTTVMGISVVLPCFSQPCVAMYTDPNKKIVLPSDGEIESSLLNWNLSDNPLGDLTKSSFARLDETPDSQFYQDARFTEHVDTQGVEIMSNFIASDVLNENDAVLDLGCSWTSHISANTVAKYKLQRVSGLGMNEEELKSNSILQNDYTVVDLNSKPDVKLPYNDASFNVVLCQLSIDYFIHPLNVMREVGRVLKPGGKIVILFSNRLFLQKAVGLWTGKDDVDHVYIVASYLNFCQEGLFTNIVARDLSVRDKKKRAGERMVVGDPMYAVVGVKATTQLQ